MITLGCRARDKITGFEGIVVGRCDYLFGCSQWGITPAAKDGEVKSTQWFDEGRVDRMGDGVDPNAVRSAENGAGDPPMISNGRR